MKTLILAVFLVHTFILFGYAPASGYSSEDGKKQADSAQNRSDNAPAIKDKNGSEQNAKINHPETSPNQPSQPLITINAIPRIDVKRDWMDCASLIVSILLVLVAAITGYFIYRQAKETAAAARATKTAADAALLNAQAIINAERPWIVVNVESLAPGQFNFILKNVGRTPAKVRSIWSMPILTKRGESLRIPPDEQTGESLLCSPPCLIPPTATQIIFRFDVAEMDKRNAFGVNITFSQGFTELRFYGRIVYFDPLQPESAAPHETKWLYWHVPIEGAIPFPDPMHPQHNTYT